MASLGENESEISQSESKTETKVDDPLLASRERMTIKAIENSVNLKKLSSALFRINGDDSIIRIVHFVGNSSWIGMGYFLNESGDKEVTLCIFKEEMLYLMECGCCELIIEYQFGNKEDIKTIQTVIGLRNTFTLFFSLQRSPSSFNFNVYSVFKKLKMMNYVTKRTSISLRGDHEAISTKIGESQSELSSHFECIQFWIWKRNNTPWWKARNQAFEGNAVIAVKKSLNMIFGKRPDALVLIWRSARPRTDTNMKALHQMMKQMDNIPIMLAHARKGDVELLKIERNELLG